MCIGADKLNVTQNIHKTLFIYFCKLILSWRALCVGVVFSYSRIALTISFMCICAQCTLHTHTTLWLCLRLMRLLIFLTWVQIHTKFLSNHGFHCDWWNSACHFFCPRSTFSVVVVLFESSFIIMKPYRNLQKKKTKCACVSELSKKGPINYRLISVARYRKRKPWTPVEVWFICCLALLSNRVQSNAYQIPESYSE